MAWPRTLNRPRLRRCAKAGVDVACGALAVLAAALTGEVHVGGGAGGLLAWALLLGGLVALSNAVAGNYRVIWHYSGLKEAVALFATGTIVLAAALASEASGLVDISPAAVLLIPALAYGFCAGTRTARRWQVATRKRRVRARGHSRSTTEHRVLIVGAGDAGLLLSRELGQAALDNVRLIGFLDDDETKEGTLLNGAPVLGPVSSMLAIAESHGATEIIVAMPSATPDFVRTLVRRAEDVGLRARALPGAHRLLTAGDVARPGSANLPDLVEQSVAQSLPRWRAGRDRDASRRVLVTGGAGYIGAHLTKRLLDRGYVVRILDNFMYGDAGLSQVRGHPRLEIVRGDICSVRDVNRAVHGVDTVIALAAIVGDPACSVDPEETITLNYAATKVLTESCDFYGVRRLVFASSCSVYGSTADESLLLTERSRLNPVSLYARTRVLSENIIFDRSGDVEPVVLRLSTVFGLSPRMRFDLVVNTLTARAVVDKKMALFGGQQWRPNVHCRDAARAFAEVVEAPSALVAGEVFNVGGEDLNHRIADIGRMVGEIVPGVDVQIQHDMPDPRNYRVSFEKIRRTLGFVPEYSVRDGIKEVAAAVEIDHALRHHTSTEYHNVHVIRRTLERSRAAQLATA